MTDLHAQLEEWLVEGAIGEPPREVAVHAAVCETCAARIAAFDALEPVDVTGAGQPPPVPRPTRAAVLWIWIRRMTAAGGAVAATALVVVASVSALQFLEQAPPGGGAPASEGVVMGGVSSGAPEASDRVPGAQSPEPDPAQAPTPMTSGTPSATAVAASSSSPRPISTPRPSAPGTTPAPTPTSAPTPTPPPAPTITGAVFDDSGGTPTITVSWTAVSGATSYILYRDDGIVSAIGPLTATGFVDAPVEYDRAYTYWVTAWSNGLESAASGAVIVPAQPPPTPSPTPTP